MIYMIGGAGNGNFGDELIVRGWLDFLRETGVTEPVVFDENYAGVSRRFFGPNYPDARFSDDANQLKARGPDTFFAAFSRGVRFYENGGFARHPDLAGLETALAEAKVLHLHGGGYINTIWPRNAFLLGFAVATRRQFGCRLVATGLGVLPAGTPPDLYRPMLAAALDEFDLLELRDRWSYDYLRGISSSPRIVLGLDDCFLLRRDVPATEAGATGGTTGRARTLHLSWFTSAGSFDEVIDFAASVGDSGPGGFGRVLFWACIDQDMRCFEALKAACPRAELIRWQALVNGPIPVAPGDAMITARFHPHLMAARHGAVGAYRTDRGYYDVKQGSVADLGSPFRRLGETPLAEAVAGPAGGPVFSPIHRIDDERVAAKRRLAGWIYGELLQSAATRLPAPRPVPAVAAAAQPLAG